MMNKLDKKGTEVLAGLGAQQKVFKDWLRAHYSQAEIEQEHYDESGFDGWNLIEELFEEAFVRVDFSSLKPDQLEPLAYLIGRQWNMGIIFAPYNKGFSQLGMTENQFLVLAHYGLSSTDWSFQQQCAASLCKVNNDRNQAIEIGLGYYEHADADIRRHALQSLFKLNYPEILKLAELSWQSKDPMERASCLPIWKQDAPLLYAKHSVEFENIESA